MALNIESPKEFVDAISFLIAKETTKPNRNEASQPYVPPIPNFKIARVSASYTTGRPNVTFEGETSESLKQYPYLSSYTPLANDWVLLAKVGNTYVILGSIV